jgi:O-succinylbenzoic acid--CoA ligase
MPDWLAARAGLSPARLALVAGGEQLTFRELDRRASGVARRLAGLGIRPGDRVALLLRSGVPTVELVHGAGRMGAVVVPLNVRLAPAELAWQVADVRARLLLYDEANRAAAGEAVLALSAPHPPTPSRSRGEGEYEVSSRPVQGEGPGVRAISPLPRTGRGALCLLEGEGLALSVEHFAALPEVDVPLRERIDLAAVHTIVYTSGTTGRPKGAMLTYGNHWWSAVGSALNLGLRDDDRWLAPLPLFHVGGLSILMRSVIYGIPALVHDGFDPAAVNRAIDEDGVTIVSVVSSMLRRILDARAGRPYPPTLRHILLGGGPAPMPLLEECRRHGVPVVQTYGLTETASQAATLPPEDALRKPGSAGKPLLPTELCIERDGRPVPSGEAGEIVVRGPTVTPGYADRPEETARALRGGWLHTGDIGRLDDDGYLYVLDRRSDLIVSGGENVYPAEIEAVLAAHPAVAEAGVAGQDDARWGRVPVAFVALRPGASATPQELIAFCRERLARYKVPAHVHVVDTLPRNAAGKLLRHKLVPPS